MMAATTPLLTGNRSTPIWELGMPMIYLRVQIKDQPICSSFLSEQKSCRGISLTTKAALNRMLQLQVQVDKLSSRRIPNWHGHPVCSHTFVYSSSVWYIKSRVLQNMNEAETGQAGIATSALVIRFLWRKHQMSFDERRKRLMRYTRMKNMFCKQRITFYSVTGRKIKFSQV